MNQIEKTWLSIEEVSVISGESRSTLLRRMDRGILKGKQRTQRGRWLFHIKDVEKYCNRESSNVHI